MAALHFQEMEVPQELKSFFSTISAGPSLEVSDLHTSAAKLEDVKKSRQEGKLHLDSLPKAVRDALAPLDQEDADGKKDGAISADEIVRAVYELEQQKKQIKWALVLLVLGCAAVFFLMCMSYALSIAGQELTKDFRPQRDAGAPTEVGTSRRLLEQLGIMDPAPTPAVGRRARRNRRLVEGGAGGAARQSAPPPKSVGGLQTEDDKGPVNIGTVKSTQTLTGEGVANSLAQMSVEQARSVSKVSLTTAGGKIEFKPGGAQREGANQIVMPAADGSGAKLRVDGNKMTLEYPSGAREVIVTDPAKLVEMRDEKPQRAPGTGPSPDPEKDLPSVVFDQPARPLTQGEAPEITPADYRDSEPGYGITFGEYKNFCDDLDAQGFQEFACPNGTSLVEWFNGADCNEDGYLDDVEMEHPWACFRRMPPAAETLVVGKQQGLEAQQRMRRLQATEQLPVAEQTKSLEEQMPKLKGKVASSAAKEQLCSSAAGQGRCSADPKQFDRIMQKADMDGDGMFSESEYRSLVPMLSSSPESQGDASKRAAPPTGVDRSSPLLPPGSSGVQLQGGGGSVAPELAGDRSAKTRIMGQMDRNHDGTVDAAEIAGLSADPDKEACRKMDKTMGQEDGMIDAVEFATFKGEQLMEAAGVTAFEHCMRDIDGDGRLTCDEATADLTVVVNEASNTRRLRILTQHVDQHRNARRQRRLLGKQWTQRRLSHEEYSTQARRLSEAADWKGHVKAAHSSVRVALSVAKGRRQLRRMAQANRRLQTEGVQTPTQKEWVDQSAAGLTAEEKVEFDSMMKEVERIMPDVFEGAPWDEGKEPGNGSPDAWMAAGSVSCYEPLQDITVLETVLYKLHDGHREESVSQMMVDMGVDPSQPESPFLACKRQAADDPETEPVLVGEDAIGCLAKMMGVGESAATEQVTKFAARRSAMGTVDAPAQQRRVQAGQPGRPDMSQGQSTLGELTLSPDDLLELLDPVGTRRLLSCPEARTMYAAGQTGWTAACDRAGKPRNTQRRAAAQGGQGGQGGQGQPPKPMEAARMAPANYVQTSNGNYKFAPPEHEKMTFEEFAQSAMLDPVKAPACAKLPAAERSVPVDMKTGRLLQQSTTGLSVVNTDNGNMMSDMRGPGCFAACASYMEACVKVDGAPCLTQEDFDGFALGCECLQNKKVCHEEVANQFLEKVGGKSEGGGTGTTNRRLRQRRLRQAVVTHRVREMRFRKLLAKDHETQRLVRQRLRRLRMRVRQLHAERRKLAAAGTPPTSGLDAAYWDSLGTAVDDQPATFDETNFPGLNTVKGPRDTAVLDTLAGPEGPLSDFEDGPGTGVHPSLAQTTNWDATTSPSFPDAAMDSYHESTRAPSVSEACIPAVDTMEVMTEARSMADDNIQPLAQRRRLLTGNADLGGVGSGDMRSANFTGEQREQMIESMSGLPQETIDSVVAEVTLAHAPMDIQDIIALTTSGVVAADIGSAEYDQKDPMAEVLTVGSRRGAGSSAVGGSTGAGMGTPEKATAGQVEQFVRQCQDESMPCDKQMVAAAEQVVGEMRRTAPPGTELELSSRDMHQMVGGSGPFDMLAPDGNDRITETAFVCYNSLMSGMPVDDTTRLFRMTASSPGMGMTRDEFQMPSPAETMNMAETGPRGPVERNEQQARRAEGHDRRMEEDMARMMIEDVVGSLRARAMDKAAFEADPVVAESIRQDLVSAAIEWLPDTMDVTTGIATGGSEPCPVDTVLRFHRALGMALVHIGKKSGDPTAAHAITDSGALRPEYQPPALLPDGSANADLAVMQVIKAALPIVGDFGMGKITALTVEHKTTIAKSLQALAGFMQAPVPSEFAVCPRMMDNVMDSVGMDSAEGTGADMAMPGAPADQNGCVPMDAVYSEPLPLGPGACGSGRRAGSSGANALERRRRLQARLGRRLQGGSLSTVEVPLSVDQTGGSTGERAQLVKLAPNVDLSELSDIEMDVVAGLKMPWQSGAEDVQCGIEGVSTESMQSVEMQGQQVMHTLAMDMAVGRVNGSAGMEMRDIVEHSIASLTGACGPEEGCARGNYSYAVDHTTGNAITNYMSGADGIVDSTIPAEYDCSQLPRSSVLVMENQVPAASGMQSQPLDLAKLCYRAKERQGHKQKMEKLLECYATSVAVNFFKQLVSSNDLQSLGTRMFGNGEKNECWSAKRLRNKISDALSHASTTDAEKMVLTKAKLPTDDAYKRAQYGLRVSESNEEVTTRFATWLAGRPEMTTKLRQVLSVLRAQVAAAPAPNAGECAFLADGTLPVKRQPLSASYDRTFDDQCHRSDCDKAVVATSTAADMVMCMLWELPEDLKSLQDDMQLVRLGQKDMRSVVELVAPALASEDPTNPEYVAATINPEVKVDQAVADLANRRVRVRRLLVETRECLNINDKEYCSTERRLGEEARAYEQDQALVATLQAQRQMTKLSRRLMHRQHAGRALRSLSRRLGMHHIQ